MTDPMHDPALDGLQRAALTRVKTSRRLLKKAKRTALRAIADLADLDRDWECAACGYEAQLDPKVVARRIKCPSCGTTCKNPLAEV